LNKGEKESLKPVPGEKRVLMRKYLFIITVLDLMTCGNEKLKEAAQKIAT
jgi:hypothetical protein